MNVKINSHTRTHTGTCRFMDVTRYKTAEGSLLFTTSVGHLKFITLYYFLKNISVGVYTNFQIDYTVNDGFDHMNVHGTVV